ncbi:phosphopantetheine-binding protein [Symbioplanes lichenis]|uniref:phosphopantetheine-binding protein n=1 Tax=Symbioplanes lichenis TaxID=1629072 RepID=UPI0027391227|nr:phosphopantetheine-binding protein [Actinoplanes lichenis]
MGLTDPVVSDKLRTVLVAHLHPPQDQDWTTVPLADLGLDSLSAIDLVIHLEDAFGAEFPPELLVRETFATFGSLESAVRSMSQPS